MAHATHPAVVDFLELAEREPALKKSLMEAKDLLAVAQLGRDRGFEFSPADFEAAAAMPAGAGELSEDDLDRVAGGFRDRLTASTTDSLRESDSTSTSPAAARHALAINVINNLKA